MTYTLSELKRTSAERLEKLRSAMRLDLGAHKSTRLKRASCDKSKSILHDNIAKHHAKMLLDDYQRLWGKLSRDTALERLRFLTVLHSVVPLDHKDVIRAVERMESSLRRVFKGSGTKVLGTIEVEIVNIALLRKIGSLSDDETRKLNVLENIRVSGVRTKSVTANALGSGVLVHFHGVVDLGASNPLLREETLRTRLKKIVAWKRSPYQVEIKGLFKDQSPLKNLRDIASYITKGGNERLRYNAGFGRDLAEDLDAKMWRVGTGRADKGGETITDERGLTIGEIKLLDGIWRELMDRKRNKRGYLVRLVGG